MGRVRFCKVEIDGYGRFSKRTLELRPGLQIVVGPNEQGKTTLRCFIGDMLYGQRCSAMHRLYDPGHELRRPWQHPERYGGRLRYVLDDRREIRVTRRFNEQDEFVQVFDVTNARDITDSFDRLRNGELPFAREHLGLVKEVFLSTATIGHVTLDDLGDRNALVEVRAKLLSIADSREEMTSAEHTLAWLAERVRKMGPYQADTGDLPEARARRRQLQQERERTLAFRAEQQRTEERRRALRQSEEDLMQRRSALVEELQAIEAAQRAGRLEQVEELTEEINRANARCFTLSSRREFPLEDERTIRLAETAMAASRAQLETLQAEQAELARQLAAERERLGPDGHQPTPEISEETEQTLVELETRIAR
ncbi:MAG TPA: hypothetical protein ENN80_12385, partial [Candidatus Hydrogenedentes bacterium]|nr:hypothetical protein [Candidatus Hydrogenedentota bacterium]